MKSLKIILNIYMSPNSILRKLVDDNKHLYLPMSAGSQLMLSDAWCKKSLIFDKQLPDNISYLNSKLNEMTSIYACWKNYEFMTAPDYIGYNHYRRFFDPRDFTDFEDYDIIVGEKIKLHDTMLEQYKHAHHELDIEVLLGMLQQDFEKSDILKFANAHELFAPCNMFIMKRELFFQYCEFMFSKLLKLEKLVKIDAEDQYQSRALAFLSERMTSFWMKQQLKAKKKVKQIPIVFFKEWSR